METAISDGNMLGKVVALGAVRQSRSAGVEGLPAKLLLIPPSALVSGAQ